MRIRSGNNQIPAGITPNADGLDPGPESESVVRGDLRDIGVRITPVNGGVVEEYAADIRLQLLLRQNQVDFFRN